MRDRTNPGRPREFDKTEILRRIAKLFWRAGYEGVSLADIMAETGLRKGSLYAAFGDKHTLYLLALAQYHADVVVAAAEAMEDTRTPPKERISSFLSAPLEAAKKNDRTGCFLCNASADQADLNQETKRQVTLGFKRLTKGLAAALSEFMPTLDERTITARGNALLAVYSGLRVMSRSGLEIDALEHATNQAQTLMLTENDTLPT